MSTPAPAESPLLHATKKQLDELDSLIQRMLALPVVDVPDDVVAPPERQSEAEPVAEPESWQEGPPPDSPQEMLPTNEEPVEALPRPVVSETGPPAVEAESSADEFQEEAEPDEELPPLRGRFVWPLVPFNWLFDVLTAPLGPAGRWLRGEHGRTLLGFTGLALLLAAAVVGVLDWILGNW
jgi:hypothetical protein